MRTTEAAGSPPIASIQGHKSGQGRMQEKTGHNFSTLLEGLFSSSIGKTSLLLGTETDDSENEVDVRQSEGEQSMPGFANGLAFPFHPLEQTLREPGQNSFQDFIPPEILGQWDELAPTEKELARFILTSNTGNAGNSDIADVSTQTEKTIMNHVTSGEQPSDLQYFPEGLYQDVSKDRENTLPKSDRSLHNNQGALNPKAVADIVSMLREGKSLQDLPQAILQELGNFISGKFTSDERMSRERPFPEILSRLEGFLDAYLGAEREEGREAFTGRFFPEEGEKGVSAILNGKPPLHSNLGEGHFPLNSAFPNEGGEKVPFMSSYGQAREYSMLHPKEILSQIVNRMDFLARPGEQELRLKLQPEFLGEVLVRVRIMNERLTGEIITSHIAVKELLEGQLETLRQRFQEMDLNLEHFKVSVRDEAHDGTPFGRGPEFEDFPWGDGPESLKEGERVVSSTPLWGGGRMVDYFV